MERLTQEISPARARIGVEVAARLAAAGAHKAVGHHLTLWYVEGFLTSDECGSLIDRIETDRQPSGLLSDDAEQDFRTSDSCNLDRYDPLVEMIDRRICALMGLGERHGETLQGQRYAPGQFFRTHHDFFHTDQAYWPAQAATGGQRTWTAMIFLNQPSAGGETGFESAGLTVLPRPGMLLMWDNMDATGAPNAYSAHEGRSVAAGVKYIVTKWFREGHWF